MAGAQIMMCAALVGCSTVPVSIPSGAALAPRTPARTFTAGGRIAARATGDAARGFSGGFNWTHDASGDTIELLTPTGQLAARMTSSSSGAAVEMADGRRSFAADPEQFLAQTTGVSLPVAALPYWMQAVPLASSPFTAETDAIGRPSTLWQNGWQIQYTAYADDTVAANPTRMQLNQGDVEARLVISEWRAP